MDIYGQKWRTVLSVNSSILCDLSFFCTARLLCSPFAQGWCVDLLLDMQSMREKERETFWCCAFSYPSLTVTVAVCDKKKGEITLYVLLLINMMCIYSCVCVVSFLCADFLITLCSTVQLVFAFALFSAWCDFRSVFKVSFETNIKKLIKKLIITMPLWLTKFSK